MRNSSAEKFHQRQPGRNSITARVQAASLDQRHGCMQKTRIGSAHSPVVYWHPVVNVCLGRGGERAVET